MPNHVKNILSIDGEINLVKSCLNNIKGRKDNQLIDFNKITPLPSKLEGTRSPSKIISEKEYQEQEERIKRGELTEIEKNYGLSRGITKAIQDELIKEFGCDNWYDWSLENWGTKWNAYDQEIISPNSFSFFTAWGSPNKIIETLSLNYPSLIFRIDFADEDFGYNVGSYTLQNGQYINHFMPEGGSFEAIKMAMKIRGDEEYYLEEYLSEETDKLDTFKMSLISLAHEEQYLLESYPKNVLIELREMAILDEQFERVIEINKLINEKQI